MFRFGAWDYESLSRQLRYPFELGALTDRWESCTLELHTSTKVPCKTNKDASLTAGSPQAGQVCVCSSEGKLNDLALGYEL